MLALDWTTQDVDRLGQKDFSARQIFFRSANMMPCWNALASFK
jgi:hypothetical protein